MFERRQFSRRAKRIRDQYEPQIEKSFEESDPEKSKKLQADMYLRLDTLQMQIEEWEDNQLLMKAHRLDIEEPFYKDQTLWEKVGSLRVLTSNGRLAIRKAIDEERTRRREVAAWWWKTVIIPCLTAATGVIGALTGLCAILRHK